MKKSNKYECYEEYDSSPEEDDATALGTTSSYDDESSDDSSNYSSDGAVNSLLEQHLAVNGGDTKSSGTSLTMACHSIVALLALLGAVVL